MNNWGGVDLFCLFVLSDSWSFMTFPGLGVWGIGIKYLYTFQDTFSVSGLNEVFKSEC